MDEAHLHDMALTNSNKIIGLYQESLHLNPVSEAINADRQIRDCKKVVKQR